jgi:hypothetical protein
MDDGARPDERDPRGLPSQDPRPDLDPALIGIAHPTETQRIRRGALLGTGYGVLLLVLAGRRPAAH